MNCSKNVSLTIQSKLPLVVAIAMLTAPLSGCISSQANPNSMIVGQWQSELAGFVLVTVYTSTEVFLDEHPGLPYAIQGNQLIIDGDENAKRELSFPSRNIMIQIDSLTNSRRQYRRIY